MSQTLRQVQQLIASGSFRISEHAYDEMLKDGLIGREVIDGVNEAMVVEDYPTFAKGPCVLVRQRDVRGEMIHALWGTWIGTIGPAVLITVYRPDPAVWDASFLRRL